MTEAAQSFETFIKLIYLNMSHLSKSKGAVHPIVGYKDQGGVEV